MATGDPQAQPPQPAEVSRPDRPVVIFDGVCNLCNGAIDFLIRRDRDSVFLVAAAQSQVGGELLGDRLAESAEPTSIFLWEDGQVFEESTAVLRIARRLPLPWRLTYAAVIIPAPIRDAVYRWVARNRYRWFGTKDTCRIPTDDERSRFLE